MKLEKALKEYNSSCNKLIRIFSKKQGLAFDYWVSNEIGSMASFIEQYFFNMDEIVYDLKTEQPKGLIMKWQDDSIEHSDSRRINYKSYCMGFRF